jgi:transcription antitermination factor NusG
MILSWYAMRSKPRMEEFLGDQLRLRGVEVFSPFIRVQTVNPRARKHKPYFPGYLFIHDDLENPKGYSWQYLPGSAGMVEFDGEAASVPDVLINAIRQKVDVINAAGGELFEALKKGQPVVIHSGPFSGYEAIFDARLPGADRVRVLLQLLKNRHLPVDLPVGQVRLKK